MSAHPLQVGTVVPSRPIGIIELLDKGEEDNKILSVALNDAVFANYKSINDVPDVKIDKYRKFLDGLADQKGKVMEFLGFRDKDRAIEEIEKCKK